MPRGRAGFPRNYAVTRRRAIEVASDDGTPVYEVDADGVPVYDEVVYLACWTATTAREGETVDRIAAQVDRLALIYFRPDADVAEYDELRRGVEAYWYEVVGVTTAQGIYGPNHLEVAARRIVEAN